MYCFDLYYSLWDKKTQSTIVILSVEALVNPCTKNDNVACANMYYCIQKNTSNYIRHKHPLTILFQGTCKIYQIPTDRNKRQ